MRIGIVVFKIIIVDNKEKNDYYSNYKKTMKIKQNSAI